MNLRFNLIVSVLLSLLFLPTVFLAQPTVNIAFVSEVREDEPDFFRELIRSEINTLLNNRWQVEYAEFLGNHQPEQLETEFERVFSQEDIDIVIAVGPLSSATLAKRGNFTKPSIASVILDQSLQKLPLTAENSSGIANFSYIESPFNFHRDILKLYEVSPFQKLAVIGGQNLLGDLSVVEELMLRDADSLGFEGVLVLMGEEDKPNLEKVPEDVDAVYLMPLFDFGEEKRKTFFGVVNDKGLPSAGLLGEAFVESGALLGYESDDNLRRMPRRIALNVMKILEGTPAAELPVSMQSYNENLLINMATARQIGIYPTFEVMAEGTLVNMNVVPEGRVLSLQSCIAEALQNNLDLKIAHTEPLIVEKDVALARADLFPQLDVSAVLQGQDEATTFLRQGAQGQLNLLGGVSLSQVFFAEPVYANITIQKILQQSAEFELEQAQLDVILDISEAYLNVLRSSANWEVQHQNVEVTRENYDIALAKEAVGYSGATDINRWESELAVRNIDLNDAYARLQQSRFRLNQLLNRPVDEPFNLDDVNLQNQMTLVGGGRLSLINNYGDLEQFADFVVDEGLKQLPELKQIDAGIRAQDRLRQSQARANYLPSLALSGSWNQQFEKYLVPEPLVPSQDQLSTWNMNLGLSFPITQGGTRYQQLQQTKLSLIQLEDQQANARNQFELAIRSNIETVGASFSRVQLYGGAAAASRKNFEIVQNAYSEGQANVTTLIDAQNNLLQVELASINATYTFILDFLTLERSIGVFFFTLPQEERDAFINRFNQFINE